jgi:Na+-translocating ferredoxin:NAD+ oxidoreductase RnfC subunit
MFFSGPLPEKEFELDEPAEQVAIVVRNAENCCYVMQTILYSTPVERQFTLNGAAFDPDAFLKKR